jgi:hypothetical protein
MLRRILTLIAILAIPLSLTAISALPASADETAPTLSPAQGPPGTIVNASATDWPGCSSMSVTGWGATLGTTSIDASGAFSLSFTVPSNAALGATQLQFDPTCTHSTYIPFVTFTVTQETAPPPPTSAPATPSNLTATAVDPNDIRLNWQDNSSNATGFEINNSVISKNVGPNSTTYTWGGLAPGTYMCFKIRAYNTAGDSAWDPDVSPWYVCATTPKSELPAAPSNLTVYAADSHDIRLNWQDNSNNETGFEINNGVLSRDVGANTTTYTWGGLAPGTYMCFRIRAYNSAGDSAWDPDVSPWYVCATTPLPAPALSGSHVRVWGLAACTQQWPLPLPGPRWLVSRIRFQAANGETHDAKISDGFAYYVDFYHVPPGGETVNVYVTCKLSTNPSWGKQFKLTRHLTQLQYLNLLYP